MNIKRYLIIIMAAISVLLGFSHPATDNKTFERFYNLSSKEFFQQLDFYYQNNQTDSAMLCANIQVSRYGKEELTIEEIEACCEAFRYMGLVYLQTYCNYQLAAENQLKAEQIADKYEFKELCTQIAFEKAILTATQNDLENNFSYNHIVMDGFKNAFQCMLDQIKVDNSEFNEALMESITSNLLYLAIKYGKTNEVSNEVQSYRKTQKLCGTICNEIGRAHV